MLSARFGRDRSSKGLDEFPNERAGGSEDFFAELVNASPDAAVDLITKAADFLKDHRTASRCQRSSTRRLFATRLAIDDFAHVQWLQ